MSNTDGSLVSGDSIHNYKSKIPTSQLIELICTTNNPERIQFLSATSIPSKEEREEQVLRMLGLLM